MLSTEQAKEIVAQMRRETPKAARIRLMQVALRIGRLDDGAKQVYKEALQCES